MSHKILKLRLSTIVESEKYYVLFNLGERTLAHTPGNPVLIPSREVIGLKRDIFRTSLPFFSVFGSGDPQPQPTDYSWYFNGDRIFVNGVQDSSVVDVDSLFSEVLCNMITLKQRIDSGVEGIYESVVNTTAGTTNISITLNTEGKLFSRFVVFSVL